MSDLVATVIEISVPTTKDDATVAKDGQALRITWDVDNGENFEKTYLEKGFIQSLIKNNNKKDFIELLEKF